MSSNKSNIHPQLKDFVHLKIGSRKSQLAIIQTNIVIEELSKFYPKSDYNFEIVMMTTKGDHILDKPLSKIGEKALFTKELEDALLDKKIDCIVHSLKDLPTSLHPDLCIAAILLREDPNDALVLRKNLKIDSISKIFNSSYEINGCVNSQLTGALGTSSLRRIAQIKSKNRSIKTMDIRGNLTTRFRKLDDDNSPYFGLILACAGLKRAGFSDRINLKLDSNDWWHAVGQGALAIECRSNDDKILKFLSPLIDIKATYECIAERVFMQQLEGGCSVPLGVRCKWYPNDLTNDDFRKDSRKDIKLSLSGAVFSLDGQKCVSHEMEISISQNVETEMLDKRITNFTSIRLPSHDAPCFHLVESNFLNSATLGVRLAEVLKSKGVKELLNEIKKIPSS